MDVTVNGAAERLAEGTTVADLVAERAPGQRAVAVALDGAVLSRSAWPTTALRPGQDVELLTAVAGG